MVDASVSGAGVVTHVGSSPILPSFYGYFYFCSGKLSNFLFGIAGRYAGLSNDISNTIGFYNIMDDFVSHFLGSEPKFLDSYLKFAERYKEHIKSNN